MLWVRTYNQIRFKETSVIYKRLRESKALSTTYIKNKWEKELDTEITTEEWLNICETQQTTTNSRAWREFGWKNVTRYFITPKISSRQSGSSH